MRRTWAYLAGSDASLDKAGAADADSPPPGGADDPAPQDDVERSGSAGSTSAAQHQGTDLGGGGLGLASAAAFQLRVAGADYGDSDDEADTPSKAKEEARPGKEASEDAPSPASPQSGLGLASAAAFQLVAGAETPRRAERIGDAAAAATPGGAASDASDAPPDNGADVGGDADDNASDLMERSWDPAASISTEDETADDTDLQTDTDMETDTEDDTTNDVMEDGNSDSPTPSPAPKRPETTNQLLANLMAAVADDQGDGSAPAPIVHVAAKPTSDADNSEDGCGANGDADGAPEEGAKAAAGGAGPLADADADADENDYGDDFEGVEDELLESFRDGRVGPAKPQKPRSRPDEVAVDPRALARGFGAPAQERNNRRHLKTLAEDDEDEERRAVRDGASPTPDEMGHVEPHPNQELFDIIDRNFESFSPQGDPLGGDQRRYLTAEDVRLCFVAFVAIFSPPPITSLAEEYNHTLDDDLAAEREALERQRQQLDRSGSGHGELIRSAGERHGIGKAGESGADDDDSDARRRPRVPMDLVVALWEEVLRTVGDKGALKPGTNGISAARDGQYSPAISYVREALVSLGLVDIVSDSAAGRDVELRSISLDDEDGFFGRVLGGFRSNEKGRGGSRQRGSVETMVVHQSLNQQYGEYLADEHHCYEFPQIVAEYRRRWSKAVVKCSLTDSGEWSEFTSGYDLYTLPWNLTCTSMFDECAALMRDQRYVIRRLEEVGVLDGTTAHVTDVDELLRTICEQWDDYTGTVDWKIFILETYGHIKSYAASLLKSNEDAAKAAEGDREASFDVDEFGGPDTSRLLEAGRALHLIGVSLGTHGYVDEEIEYYLESLRFKEATPDGEDRVDYSDTLHCLGFAYDSVGRTDEALEKYDEALDTRLKLLGEDDLRVAETMHNKGAICCENGECDEALNCLEEALRIRREHFGDVHESCADTEQWLGNVMREWEDHEEAMMYFREALRIKKILLGKDHEDVGNTVYNLAVVLDDLGKFDVSMGCYREALRIRRLNYGADDIHTADYLQCMGNVSNALEQQQEAHDYFKESIDIREQFLQTEVADMLGGDFYPLIVELKPCGEKPQAQYEKLVLCYEEVSMLRGWCCVCICVLCVSLWSLPFQPLIETIASSVPSVLPGPSTYQAIVGQ